MGKGGGESGLWGQKRREERKGESRETHGWTDIQTDRHMETVREKEGWEVGEPF